MPAPIFLALEEQDARDTVFALRVALDSGALVLTFDTVAAVRARLVEQLHVRADHQAGRAGCAS